MKFVPILVAFGLAVIAAPLSDTSEIEKRIPDVDQEVTDNGHLAVDTNAAWDGIDEGDLPMPYSNRP
ncbi:hypothetical protein F5Y13DRAFT_184569 [Hypoxylon sp. FL1857]|nr:hypothetical protein F5Y13DRAFT_184569 [Hypoxylon sp. FL1857]